MYHQKMSYGAVLLFSVFLITIVLSINIVDAGRKKTAAELLLDSDQDLGIEVTKRESIAGLGAAAMEAVRKAADPEKVKEAEAEIIKLLETINIFLKEIPDVAELEKLLRLIQPTSDSIPGVLTKATDAVNGLLSMVQGIGAVATKG